MVENRFSDEKNFSGIMRILIATGIYPPDVGGPATYAKYLVEELSKRGHEVEVLVYTRVAKRLPKGISHFVYFLKVLKQAKKAEVILTTDTISAGLPVHFASFFLSKPYILKIGGDYVWEQGFQRWGIRELLDKFLEKRYGWKVELMRKLQSHVAKRAAKLIAPSKYLASIAEKWGVKKENIAVIYNNISISDLLFSKEEARKRSGVANNEVVLLSMGRDVPWKGFKMLEEIIPEIKKSFPKIRLVSGTFSREESRLWLQAADIFLLNTGYEGFSHSILAAMVLGLPVLTTPIGGNVEIIENGKSGLLAGYNDKKAWIESISRLLSDSSLQETISKNAKTTAKKFLNKDMVGETLQVLENIK